jgi:hypothetical protein
MSAGIQQTGGDWDFWREGLDQAFFMRVYTRTAQIGMAVLLLCLGFEQKQLALGIGCGLAVGLFSMWTVEVTVRLLFNGGAYAGVKLAVGAIVKMPFMLAGLLGIAWASFNGYMNVFGVVGGVLLAHMTMLVLVVGTAMAAQASNKERYR